MGMRETADKSDANGVGQSLRSSERHVKTEKKRKYVLTYPGGTL